jgi:hypothetical protein
LSAGVALALVAGETLLIVDAAIWTNHARILCID